MKYLFVLILYMSAIKVIAGQRWELGFQDPNELNHWYRVNDNVMGGRSESSLKILDGEAIFEGYLSLENNGGFASVRRHGTMQLLVGKPIKVTLMGDGRDYQVRLRTHKGIDGIAYVANVPSIKNKWKTFELNEEDFTPKFRGRIVREAPPLSFTDAQQLGFMLTDKKAGYFRLVIKEITQ